MTRSSFAAKARVERKMAGAASASPSAVRRLIFIVMVVSLVSLCFDLNPATIDNVVLRCAHAAVIGRKEKHHAGNIGGIELLLQALPLGDLAFALGVEPELHLPFSHNPSGKHTIDPNVFRSEFAGERSGQSADCGLGRDIGRTVGVADEPGDGTEVD